jgi:hypothetical protein
MENVQYHHHHAAARRSSSPLPPPPSPPLSPESAAAEALANARWTPTKEQITVLEGLYQEGMRTPTAEQIQHLTARLREHGPIEGKNVFYWFQNHKARLRQKQKQQTFEYFARQFQRPQPLPILHRAPGYPYPLTGAAPPSPQMITQAPPPQHPACNNREGMNDYEPRYPFGAINLLNLLLACTPYVLIWIRLSRFCASPSFGFTSGFSWKGYGSRHCHFYSRPSCIWYVVKADRGGDVSISCFLSCIYGLYGGKR